MELVPRSDTNHWTETFDVPNRDGFSCYETLVLSNAHVNYQDRAVSFGTRILNGERVDRAASVKTYRIRKSPRARASGERGGFRTQMEALSEEDGRVLATCAFSGRAALSILEIAATDGTRWVNRPKRKVMPTAWSVSAEGEPVVELSVSFWRSFVNPLQRTAIRVCGPSGRELFRVADQRKSKADRLLGAGPIEWMFVRDGQEIGKLIPLAKPERKDAGRIRGFLSGLGNDVGVVSFADEHILAAPAALALAAIHADLTDPS